ncbi:MAG: type II toxin-antitoxin system VapC family toxin [Desulfobacteraceae bacterium]|nr:MAG: type II toxin-antitoxin system VapC family toxin [Desulfobacteraceae bacterium]
MQALLDTSSFLWFITDNEKISDNARTFLADLDNDLILSIASLWEMAIKISINKLVLMQPFAQLIPDQLQKNRIRLLPIETKHLSILLTLPFHHRDPFDRLIMSQAIAEEIPLIGSDAIFQKYNVKLIW